VLEHCREGETNCWFPILLSFLSDRIPEAKKDANIRFFIHSFPFRGEIIMNNALTIKMLPA
jgi:hypothetical protein